MAAFALSTLICGAAATCVDVKKYGETCSQAHSRGLTCSQLQHLGYTCCPPCADGASGLLSPTCPCDTVVVTGACQYASSTSIGKCWKPDALGVYSKDTQNPGRYRRDAAQPARGVHADAETHSAHDATSRGGGDVNFLYQHEGAWHIGPRPGTDDAHAKSATAGAACPTSAGSWSVFWGGGLAPEAAPLTRTFAGAAASRMYSSSAYSSRYRREPGWVVPKNPLIVSCWAPPPSPPPPPPRSPPPPPPMPPAPLRLVPGPLSGRLEVAYLEAGSDVVKWGTVCDDGFDESAAHVACRQLGLGRPVLYWKAEGRTTDDSYSYDADSDDDSGRPKRPSPAFCPMVRNRERQRTTPILMSDLTCGGDEAGLSNCPFGGWGKHNCLHGEDVCLACSMPLRRPPPPPPPPPKAVFEAGVEKPVAVDEHLKSMLALAGVIGAGAAGALVVVCALLSCLFYRNAQLERERAGGGGAFFAPAAAAAPTPEHVLELSKALSKALEQQEAVK